MEICRICLQENKNDLLRSVFDRLENDDVISYNIKKIANIDIHPKDNLPKTICHNCVLNLKFSVQFIELCQLSDKKLRNIVSDKKLDLNGSVKEEAKKTNIDVEDVRTKNSSFPFTSRKSHQCSVCGKVMSSGFRLKTHLVTHTKERPYECELCGKKFSLLETLNVHKRIHTGEKPFHCQTCGKSFAHLTGLITHKRRHSGQLPYQCHLCPKRFRTIGHLKYHICKHTGQTNFECDTCGRGFITRQDLKQHITTHVGEKPYVCCVCGLRLSRAYNLKRHLKIVHPDHIVKDTPNNKV